MTKKEAMRITHQENTLMELGFTQQEAEQLRRISMTLQRWHELECGDGNQHNSWAIERDDETEIPYFVQHHYFHGSCQDRVTKRRIPDRETGARKRLAAIIKARNARKYVMGTDYYGLRRDEVSAYIQTDHVGAALYIIRPGDVPEGGGVGAYYNRGICVY